MEMSERSEALGVFLEDWNTRPVVDGESDCTAWPAVWVRQVTGRDVPLTYSYSSMDEARSLIDDAGGLEHLWRPWLQSVGGCFETQSPALGDVGIVRTSRFGPVGVIFCAGGYAAWRMISPNRNIGFLLARPRTIVVAWSVP